MNARPMMGISLLIAALIGFVVGRFMPSEGQAHAATPEAMATALRIAFVEPDPMLRASGMERLIAQLDERNLPGAIEVFREFSTRAETLGVSEFFARWSRIDVEGLALAMRSWPDEKASAQGVGWVAYQYAFEGGTAKAIPYYEGLSPSMRLITGYRLVEGALNRGDDAGLVEWIGSLQDAAERSRLTQSIILKLLRERGSESAIAYFDSVPADVPNGYKRQIFLVLLDKLVRQDVESALAFRAARASELYAENSLNQFAAAWADVDPVAAIAWAERLTAGPEKEQALETLIDRWATRDRDAAIEWTRKQVPSPMTDRLSHRFVGAMTIRNPDLAMDLAAGIVNTEMQSASLFSFARYWFMRKPEQTRAWLQRGGLSEAETKAMIQDLTKTREQRLGKAKSTPAGN